MKLIHCPIQIYAFHGVKTLKNQTGLRTLWPCFVDFMWNDKFVDEATTLQKQQMNLTH